MIDAVVAGALAVVVLAGAYKLSGDLFVIGDETYHSLIARTSLLDLEGRWRGLAGSGRQALLEAGSLCNEDAPVLASWCEGLSAQFARRQLHSLACLRKLASGHLQATIVWSATGDSGLVGRCWLGSEKSHHHEWH